MVGSEKDKTFKSVKCVVVGDGAVGKTSMLLSYTTRGYMSDYIPTIFDSFPVTMACEDETFKVTLVDTAGQETYDRIRTLTYYDADIFILCFSLVEPSSFENLSSRWLSELKHYRPQTPFMVVGTHLDIREEIIQKEGIPATRGHTSRKERTFITHRKASKWTKRNGAVGYVECSSLTGEGVDDVFQMALCRVVAPKKKRSLRRFFWKV